MATRPHPFTRFAWGFFAYLIAVILFGAWVRITHSGAGCGSHWPTCNGEVIPPSPSVETIIEYTHRLTSGVLGLLGLGLAAWAALRFRHSRVTVAAFVTLVFIVIEAAIGAGLVLQELVADDTSGARAIVVALHLVNTLMLTAAAALTAWWSHDDRPFPGHALGAGRLILVGALTALIITAMTGAVTALGDTLFPVDPTLGDGLVDRVRDELSPASHFLVRLRIVHPIIAVLSAGAVYGMATWVIEHARDGVTPRLARGLRHAVITAVVVGTANILLAAPGWMQLLHLLVAQLLWVTAVLTAVSVLAAGVRPAR